MLRRVLFLMILPFLLLAEDFMSHFEYGQMLYNNPRGVSCAKCHGIKAKGKVIATYTEENGQTVYISSPNITNISLQQMILALSLDHKIMPKYYLTKQEIKAIYDYIQQIR